MRIRDSIDELLIRIAAGGALPSTLFLKPPDPVTLAARKGMLSFEIVSHCWQYAHLLAYQLSSIANFPPTRATLRMTVFHAPEDVATRAMLDFFGAMKVPNVEWNWQPLARERLFRRAIGRNLVARSTRADWVWFTDCDILFHRDCLDTLASALQGRRDPLCYPKQERVTAMLAEGESMLSADRGRPQIVDIDTSNFTLQPNPPRAKGAYQIVHGDVARQCGYCEQLSVYQRPARRWAKTYEDSAFRWLLRTDGTGLDIPGVYRIRHIHKGRYGENRTLAGTRSAIRRARYRLGAK